MGNYENLKNAISSVIKTNGQQLITGQAMQDTLLSMVDSLSDGATFVGIALPTTNPGTPDQAVFYLTSTNGTYTYFGNITVSDSLCVLTNKSGSWAKFDLNIPNTSALSSALNTKQDKIIAGSGISIADDGKTISSTVTGGGSTKPDGGWTKSDLSEDVQTSLSRIDSVTESLQDVIDGSDNADVIALEAKVESYKAEVDTELYKTIEEGGTSTEYHDYQITLEKANVTTNPQYGKYWSQNSPAKLTSTTGTYAVSKRIKVNSGDSVTFNIPSVSGSSLIVKATLPEEEWVSDTNSTVFEQLWHSQSGLSGTWTNEGDDCYISFTYMTDQANSVVLRTKQIISVGGDTVKTSRISALENKVKNLEEQIGTGGGSSEEGSTVTPMPEYGYFGSNFPSQVAFVKDTLIKDDCLNFVHISDTHCSNAIDTFGNACDFTDKIGVDFLVNTGDVCGTNAVGFNNSKNQILAMTKPCYLVMGNHDYEHTGSTTETNAAACYTKYFAPTNEHNGIDTNGKTYYSVVKTIGTQSIRCLFIDMYCGMSSNDGNIPSQGAMNLEGIQWFINELATANTNNEHLMCFIHSPFLTNSHLSREGWDEYCQFAGRDSGSFVYDHSLLYAIDAFMNKQTINILYNSSRGVYNKVEKVYIGTVTETSTSYNIGGTNYDKNADRTLVKYTFTRNNRFVGWFAGHLHAYLAGRIEGHEQQYQFGMRAYKGVGAEFMEWSQHTENVAVVSVCPALRNVTVYNVGTQDTRFGFKRDYFNYKY